MFGDLGVPKINLVESFRMAEKHMYFSSRSYRTLGDLSIFLLSPLILLLDPNLYLVIIITREPHLKILFRPIRDLRLRLVEGYILRTLDNILGILGT